jgi:hypothetical protein
MYASWNGHTEAIKLFLSYGADVNAKTKVNTHYYFYSTLIIIMITTIIIVQYMILYYIMLLYCYDIITDVISCFVTESELRLATKCPYRWDRNPIWGLAKGKVGCNEM